jgi:hypothetical protein
MMCQEQIGLIVAGLGVWYGLTRGRLSTGLGIAALGVLVTGLDFAVVLRHFSGGSPYFGRLQTAGGSFRGIATNLVMHPLRIARTLQGSDVLYALVLVSPVLGLCLASTITLAGLPQVALLTLSDNQLDWNYSHQLVLPLIPFVYAGTVLALSRREETPVHRRLRFRADHVFVASVAFAVVLGPFNPVGLLHTRSTAQVSAERHAVGLVPADASVSATNYLGSHLAARRYLDVFPVVKGADWIVINAADDFLPPIISPGSAGNLSVGAHDLSSQPKRMKRIVRKLERSPHWRTVYTSGSIHVFARRHGRAA